MAIDAVIKLGNLARKFINDLAISMLLEILRRTGRYVAKPANRIGKRGRNSDDGAGRGSALHFRGGAARCVRRHIPGALSILKGAVPDRARGLGHTAPTYFCREPGIDAPTADAAPHFSDALLPPWPGLSRPSTSLGCRCTKTWMPGPWPA